MTLPADILRAVAKAGEVAEADLRGHGRARCVSYPRHVAIIIMRDRFGYSFTRIARVLGNRHKATTREAYYRTKARLPRSIEHTYLLQEAQSLLSQPSPGPAP